MSGHFDFQILAPDGTPMRDIREIFTLQSLILNCDYRCDPAHVTQMAEIARQTPDYPVDISAWSGPKGARFMVWSARIYWRTK